MLFIDWFASKNIFKDEPKRRIAVQLAYVVVHNAA